MRPCAGAGGSEGPGRVVLGAYTPDMDGKVAMLAAFSDKTRLRILHLLKGKGEEHCVAELVQALRLPQPKVSQHLAGLKSVGLIRCRKISRWCYYRLVTPRSKFHEQLVNGLLDSLASDPVLRRDRARLKKVGAKGSCCT